MFVLNTEAALHGFLVNSTNNKGAFLYSGKNNKNRSCI